MLQIVWLRRGIRRLERYESTNVTQNSKARQRADDANKGETRKEVMVLSRLSTGSALSFFNTTKPSRLLHLTCSGTLVSIVSRHGHEHRV